MSWVSWEDLGAPPGGFRGAPRGVSRNPGACNLYVWGADGGLWQRWWDGIWHRKWEEHGGLWASEPSPDSMHADQEQVFIRGPDGLVHQKSWTPNTWSTWASRGAPPPGFRGAPHAISRGSDLVNIYVWGADGRLWQRGHWFNDWHDWSAHEGEIASEPSPASRHVNSEHVYARGTDGHVVQKRFLAGSDWSAWTDLGEPPGGFQGAPQAISRDDAEMLYVWGNDGRLWRRRSLSDLTWTDWKRHTSAELASEPSLVRVGAGTEHIVVRGADGQIHWLRPEFDAAGEIEGETSSALLLVRGADLVVLVVRWADMDLAEGSVSDPQMLVAGADGGRLIVMLPPQHVGETPGRGFGDAVAQPARIAGPSQLGFDIPAGRTVRLTAEGVLEAMYTLVAAPADFTGTVADETAIEMPWGLLMSVDTPANDETTHAQHVKAPRASPAGAVELWHTLIVRSGSAPSSTEKGAIDSWDARLRLRPISHWQDPPPREAEQAFRPPLTGDQRAQIVQNGRLSAGVTSEPVMADRMMLSALGGWLNAEGTWPTFEWEHEAVCGRDMRVRTVRHGMLYPLGHRADYVELTERQIDPMDAPDHFLEGALLSKTGTLFIREAVHQYPAEVSPEFREFPFWEVEIATPAVTDLDPPVWERDRRSVGMGSIAEEVARLSIQIDMEEKDPENKRRLEERRAELWKLKDQLERDYGSDFDVFFLPTIGGKPVLLPVTLRGAGGDVLVRMAQIFVAEEVRAEEERPVGLAEPIILGAYNSFTEPGIRKRLHAAYERTPPVELAGLPVALAGTHRFEVHAFRTEASATGSSAAAAGFRPRISEATIELPAVRKLASSPSRHAVVFTKAYKTSGQTDAVFEPVAESGQIDVAFAGSDHAGGLATPSFVANAISGIGAPVSAADIEPSDFFKDGANLLGIVPLAEVVRGDPKKRPSITSVRQAAGLPPSVSLLWEDVILKSQGPFQTIDDRSRLTLKVESSVADGGPPGVTTSGTLTLFKLEFAGVLVVSFDQLKFESRPNAKPSLTVAGFALEFEGDLSFLTVLRDAVAAIAQDIPAAIDAKPSEVTISQSIALPTTSFGVGLFAVTVRDAVFQTTVRLPFNGPVAVDFSFGSRKHPFLLGVWILGGGGYLELEIRAGEIERVSASVEVGGLWSLDWVVVSGEVHALAGIEIHLENRSAKLSGYLRVGGSVEALGLVSVSLELTAAIEAGSTGPNEAFQVRATGSVVIEIDLFLLSTDLRLEKTIVIYTASATGDARLRVTAADADAAPVAAFLAALAAPDAAEPVSLDDARNAWMEYRAAFAA